MMKKTLTILIISFLMGSCVMAQTPITTIYMAELAIHPDAKNKKGCIFTLPHINQSFGPNNQIRWEFNLQELTPTVDAENYFAETVNKEWKITFIDPQANDRLSAEKLSANESMILGECIFNGIIVSFEMKITKKLNKEKEMYNEISFSFPSHRIGLNATDDLSFVLKLHRM